MMPAMLTFRCLKTAVLLVVAAAFSPMLGAAELIAPPLVGAPEMREARVWVQTGEPAEVRLAYWPQADPSARTLSAPVQSEQHNANTAILVAGPLAPGQTYGYEVQVNGRAIKTDTPTSFTTAPMFRGYAPAPDFTVALGGGHYVNDAPYDPLNRTPGGDNEIFLSIYSRSPDLMIWTGNNLHLHEADYGSRSGIFDRYTKSRSVEEMAPLLASVPNAAVWGAEDYGDATDGKSFRNRAEAREAFERFWPNPPANATETLATSFTYSDAEFFLLDVNSGRDTTANIPSERTFLGSAQIDWLLKQLTNSNATFKVVVAGGSILSPSDEPDQAMAARNERDALLNALLRARVSGIIFICGGKNYGELTKVSRPNAPPLYELSLGPLTHRPDAGPAPLNHYREPSTTTYRRQFALAHFKGAEGSRSLTLEVFDSKGQELWSRTLNPSDLSY